MKQSRRQMLRSLIGSSAAVGFGSVAASADLGDGLNAFDSMMRGLRERFQLPGGALAIARRGKLVLARGYGLADVAAKRSLLHATPVCLAGLNRTLTTVAALKLAQHGRLQLDDLLVEIFSDLSPLPHQTMRDPRFPEITLRHLLLNAGGWDGTNSASHFSTNFGRQRQLADEAGLRGPLTAALRYRIALGQPLDFTPGLETHCSEFGWVLARAVIERAAGESYDDFISDSVLRPLGVSHLRLEPAAPTYLPGEARRHSAGGEAGLPGGYDSVGSVDDAEWVGSAADLVRVLVGMLGHRGRAFLSPPALRGMLAPPPPPFEGPRGGAHVAMGWDKVEWVDQGFQCTNSGARPGVRTFYEVLADGTVWAAWFNADPAETPGQPGLESALHDQMHQTLGEIRSWPANDLFGK